jgi:hypothetical protein
VDVYRAADLYAPGWTLRQIGAELGVPWIAVGHQLRNPELLASRRPFASSKLQIDIFLQLAHVTISRFQDKTGK